ncbi:MAG: GNAT family N-acetyltransferase [Bacteroidales bacterium]|nr:GNAT family N-acetyltransferase [Bacteroidales bacterium]
MVIKELQSLNTEQIADLLNLMGQLSRSTEVTPQMLQQAAACPDTHLFAAMEGGRIIGTASLVILHQPTGTKGRIEDVVVSEAFRGQHIGRKLVEHLIDFARKEFAPIQLQLTSRPSREAANRLYLSLGFEPYETNVYKLSL